MQRHQSPHALLPVRSAKGYTWPAITGPSRRNWEGRLLGKNRGLDVADQQRQVAGLEVPRLAGAHKIDKGGTFGFGQMRWRAQAGCASI
jgi:hypothetical protein